MIPQIAKALAGGFTAKQIIDLLMRKFPEKSGQITKALAAGYTIEQVLKFIGGGRKALSELEKVDPNQGLTEHERTRGMDIQRRENVSKGALAAGGLAATSLGAPIISNAVQRAMPQVGAMIQKAQQTLGMPQIPGESSVPQAQIVPSPSQPPASNLGSTIPEATQIPQAKGIPNPKEFLEKLGIREKVDSMLKAKNTPEAIAAALNIGTSGKKASGQIDPEIVAAIDAYSKEKPEETKVSTTVPTEEMENVPIKKADTVITPQGIGQVKEIRNGQAVVDVDGKLHKVKEEDLEPPSYSEDEIADAYDNLMAKIPEEHKSGFISWAAYDEDRNVLGFIPRGGKYEELHNITPEEAQTIKEGKGVARTTGETREGLWVTGEDTRGGVISQIIWDRKKKKDSEDEKQLKLGFELPKPEKADRGMKPVFDEMKHARELSRERERKKKLEEREKKKKEKDEAKKRKK